MNKSTPIRALDMPYSSETQQKSKKVITFKKTLQFKAVVGNNRPS